MLTTRKEVYEAIDSERAYQKHVAEKVSGPDSGEHKHSIEEFVLYMDDYMTELKHQLSRTWTASGSSKDVPAAIHTLRKVTALGVACMEQNGTTKREGF